MEKTINSQKRSFAVIENEVSHKILYFVFFKFTFFLFTQHSSVSTIGEYFDYQQCCKWDFGAQKGFVTFPIFPRLNWRHVIWIHVTWSLSHSILTVFFYFFIFKFKDIGNSSPPLRLPSPIPSTSKGMQVLQVKMEQYFISEH
jgi:hypothetical protein